MKVQGRIKPRMNMLLSIIELGIKFMEYLLDLWQVVESDGKSVGEGK